MHRSNSGFSPEVVKKSLTVTAVLTVFTGTCALADSMNLAWQVCRTAGNNALLATNDFTPVMPCDDGRAPWEPRRIVMSFKNTTLMTDFRGTTIFLSVLVAGSSLPDFWNFGPGGCSEGMVGGASTLINADNCENPYTLDPVDPAGQTDLSHVVVDAANSRVHYEADHVRNVLGADLPVPTSRGGYIANRLALPYGYSDGSIAACAGCDVPACFSLDRVVYFSLSESRPISNPELRNRITWGTVGYFGYQPCPGVVPAVTSTWGQVKALYR